jgi:hypothetical protein
MIPPARGDTVYKSNLKGLKMYDVLKRDDKSGLSIEKLKNIDYPTAWRYVTTRGGEIWHGFSKVIVISKSEFNKRYPSKARQ